MKIYENNIQNMKYKIFFQNVRLSFLIHDYSKVETTGRAHRAHGIPLLVRRAVSAGQTADDPDDI